jgi:putative ABC transport system permease protein
VNTNVSPNLLRPRWRKVFSDLWDDKTRTGLVVASIAVGVFAIGMILNAFVILGDDINQSYASVNPPNIVIWTDPFDQDLVRTVARMPGVKDAEGRRLMTIRGRRGAGKWQDLSLVVAADLAGQINHLGAIEGTQFPGNGEVSISQDMIHVTGWHPGDDIEIELPEGAKRHLTVVGLVTDQTSARPDPGATCSAYITLNTLRGMQVDGYFNQLYVTVGGDGSHHEIIARVAAAVKDKLERGHRVVYRMEEKLSTEHPMTSTILAVLGVLGALGGLITLLSTSLIINTLSALLTQQLRQIGIMKLVGGRSRQILGMYLTLIIAYAAAALFLAVPLGALAGYGLAWFIANLLGAVLRGFRVIPLAVVAQILIATLIPLGAGFFPVNSGAKTTIQRAISYYRPGDQAAKSNVFNRNARWFSWISRPILLSFRNTFRKRGRLLLTLFTLTVAGAVFIAVFNVRDSMGTVMDQLMQHFQGDVTVTFRRPYKVSQIEQALLGIPGVAAVEGWGGVSGEIWDQNDDVVTRVAIVAPPQDTRLLRPDFVAGRWLLPDEKSAIIISDSIYKLYPNLKPGDTFTIKLPGRLKEPWTVVGVFRFVDMMDDPIAYANFDFLASKTQSANQAASYRITAKAHEPAAQLALTQRIDGFLRDQNYQVQSVESGYVLRTAATQAVGTLVAFLLIMAILTAFVGSIGLTGTMSINVLERTREIGVMRTIGAVDRVIMQSVVIEALVIGLMTWLLAIGLSFPISALLLTIVGEAMMGSALTLSFTPLGILVWLAVVIVLSIFASVMPARSAARLTINEVLAYE